MKRYLYMLATVIGIYGGSEGMVAPNRSMEVLLDPLAVVNDRTQSPVSFDSPFPNVFVVTQDIDSVMAGTAVSEFNSKLSLFASEALDHVVQNYLEFLMRIPEDGKMFVARKANIESYFSNVLEVFASLLSSGSVNQDEQYKLVSIASLIRNDEKLYNQQFREEAGPNRKLMIEEYDEDCRERVTVLADLAVKGEIILSANECYMIAKILNNKNIDNNLLLNDLSSRGLSLIKERNGVFCRPDLSTTIAALKTIDISALKADTQNLLLYMATIYCLSNIDSLAFPMSVYDTFTDEEVQLRNEMIRLAREQLEQFVK